MSFINRCILLHFTVYPNLAAGSQPHTVEYNLLRQQTHRSRDQNLLDKKEFRAQSIYLESQVALESHSSRDESRGLCRVNKVHDVC